MRNLQATADMRPGMAATHYNCVNGPSCSGGSESETFRAWRSASSRLRPSHGNIRSYLPGKFPAPCRRLVQGAENPSSTASPALPAASHESPASSLETPPRQKGPRDIPSFPPDHCSRQCLINVNAAALGPASLLARPSPHASQPFTVHVCSSTANHTLSPTRP